jgi:hypothetical protein
MLVVQRTTAPVRTGGDPVHERALGVVLAWYSAVVTAYLGVAHALPAPGATGCTELHCGPSTRLLMLTVGAGVGLALLLCALLISAVVISVHADRARSAVVLGTAAAWTGLAGALMFLAAAVLLYTGL